MKNIVLTFSLILAFSIQSFASMMLIPMDTDQKDHLKAYGIAYWVLNQEVEAWWLLNYRGGSFAFPYTKTFEKECLTRNVSYEVLPDAAYNKIINDIANPEVNMDVMKLEVAPKIAVYTPEFNARHGRRCLLYTSPSPRDRG